MPAAGSAPAVKADTLVRIDPATNKISAVVNVGQRPSAIAVGGRSVWVYNDAGPSVSEIDAATATAPTHDEARRRAQPQLDRLRGAGARGRHRRRLARRHRRARKVVSHAGVLGVAGSASTGCKQSPVRSRSATAPSGSSRAGSRQPGAAHRPGHRQRHAGGRTSRAPRRSMARRRPWRRLGRGIVDWNALPDQPSLGTPDGRDRPRKARGPARGGARLDWVGLSDSGGDTVIVDRRMVEVSTSGAVHLRGATTRPGTVRSGPTTRRPGPSSGGTVRLIRAPSTFMLSIRRSMTDSA